MKSEFAKLYETVHGQILVKLDSSDEGNPEVRFYNAPHEDLGVCSVALSWDDTDEGWGLAEKVFAECTEEKAIKAISQVLEAASAFSD